jgi:hypothetical protein
MPSKVTLRDGVYRTHVTLALAQLWQGGDPAIRQAIVEAILSIGPASLD